MTGSISTAALVLILGLAGAALAEMGGGEPVQDAPPAAPSFAKDIVPILKRRCATCHLTGDEPGGMALYPAAAYDSLVGAPSLESPLLRVAPGKPEESYVFRKLEGTHIEAGGYGDGMPLDGWPLDAPDIDLFKRWIAAGAPDN